MNGTEFFVIFISQLEDMRNRHLGFKGSCVICQVWAGNNGKTQDLNELIWQNN